MNMFWDTPTIKCHSIVRSDIPKDVFRLLNKSEAEHIRSLKFFDRIFTLGVLFSGNIRTLPILYQIRAQGNSRLIHDPVVIAETNSEKLMENNLDRDHIEPICRHWNFEEYTGSVIDMLERSYRSPVYVYEDPNYVTNFSSESDEIERLFNE